MIKKGFISDILTSGSKESSIRLTMLWGMLMSTVVLLSISFIIIYSSVNDKTLDWNGMSLFMGALSTFMGVLIYGKVTQKKQEVYENINECKEIQKKSIIINDTNKYNDDLNPDVLDDTKMNQPPKGKII